MVNVRDLHDFCHCLSYVFSVVVVLTIFSLGFMSNLNSFHVDVFLVTHMVQTFMREMQVLQQQLKDWTQFFLSKMCKTSNWAQSQCRSLLAFAYTSFVDAIQRKNKSYTQIVHRWSISYDVANIFIESPLALFGLWNNRRLSFSLHENFDSIVSQSSKICFHLATNSFPHGMATSVLMAL